MMDERTLELYQSEKGYQTITRWYDNLLESFNFPYESRYVETRFGETHYLEAGLDKAEALILVQAIAGSAPLWYHQIPALAKHFRVLALDTPGMPGRSAPNPPSILENQHSKWLLDVMDNLGLEQASLAGVSSGGWYVMRFAIKYPERAKRIVMLSPTGLARAQFPLKIFLKNILSKKKDDQTLEKELSTRSFMPSSASEEFDRNLARAMALATRHFRLGKSLSLYPKGARRVRPGRVLRLLRTLFFPERKKVMSRLQTRGLVILGEHEMLFNSEKVAQKVNQTHACLEAVVIPGTGHSAMYDRPDLVNSEIINFLRAAGQEPVPCQNAPRKQGKGRYIPLNNPR